MSNKIEKTLKWQFLFSFNRNYCRMPESGWHVVQFGVFKFTKFPEAGDAISKKDYKGFIIRFSFWFPIDNA